MKIFGKLKSLIGRLIGRKSHLETPPAQANTAPSEKPPTNRALLRAARWRRVRRRRFGAANIVTRYTRRGVPVF